MSDYEHKDQRTPDPEEMRLQREEIEAHLKEEKKTPEIHIQGELSPKAEKSLVTALHEKYPWANQPLNTAYLKVLEQKLAKQAETEKETHRPKSSPAYHPGEGWVEVGSLLLAEDSPTPDEPQPVIDFPTGRRGPDDNRYAGILTNEKDLDAAVARVFLKSIQLLPWLAHIHKMLCDAQASRDWSRVSKAEDSVKLLSDHLSQNGGAR